jgi:hypothetical protein
MRRTRTPGQIRVEVAHHEAAHTVASHLLGRAGGIERIQIPRVGEVGQQGATAGCVRWIPETVTTLCRAQEVIVELLAGEAGVMVAWDLGFLGDADIGGREVISVANTLAVPDGAAPHERAAFVAWYRRRDHPDETRAAELARAFTTTELERATLLNFCRARTTALVATLRFQHLMGELGAALLASSGSMDGREAVALLERADRCMDSIQRR